MVNKKYFDKLSFLDYGDIYVKDTESREKNTQLESELNTLSETVNNNKNEADNKINDIKSLVLFKSAQSRGKIFLKFLLTFSKLCFTFCLCTQRKTNIKI